MKFLKIFQIVVGVTLITSSVCAQTNWPSKPIRLVVPFAAGGATDNIARPLAQELLVQARWQVLIENRPGAGANVGAELVAKSPADGYTWLMTPVSSHGINPSLYAQSGNRLNFDPIKDFSPVSLVAEFPNVLVVNPAWAQKNNINTVKDLIRYARHNPGKINMGSSGNGTSVHMTGELFKSLTKTFMVHLPYRGSAPAISDLLSGNIDIMFDNLPSSIELIRSGRLKALAVTSTHRSKLLPNLPTVSEAADLPGFEATAWFGVIVPANTPPEIVDKINQQIVKAVNNTALKEKYLQMGATPVTTTPAQFAKHIKSEIDKWAKVVKASDAKVD